MSRVLIAWSVVCCFWSGLGWGQVSISNDYLQVSVNAQNGNMTILTTRGDPANPLDDNLAITDPEDSAVILRLYNVHNVPLIALPVDLDLRAGGAVNGVLYALNTVARYPNMIRTQWLVYIPDLTGTLPPLNSPSLVVERDCVLVGDAAEIRVRVKSQENISREIGIGIVIDPGFNTPENATTDTPGPFAVSNSSTIINFEQVFLKVARLPDFWIFIPTGNAVGTIKGTVNAGEGPLPDKVLFALVPSLQREGAGFGFDYTPNPYNSLSATIDSAVGLYWTRLALPARGKVEVVTHVGMNLGPADYRSPMSLRVSQPAPLELQIGDDLTTPEVETAFPTPNPFLIRAFVYNAFATPLSNVSVTLGLPEGLSFPPGESATKVLASVPSQGELSVDWSVRVNPGTVGVKELVVTAYSPQVGIRQVRVPIVIPYLPVLTLKAGYNLVGFPFQFTNPEPSVALGIPPEELQLAKYDTVLGDYLIYRRHLQFNRLELGVGYWLRVPTDMTLNLQNVNPLPIEETVTVPLRRGWNLLSNPFPFAVLLRGEGIQVGSDPVTFTFEEAVAKGWVRGALFTWRNDPTIPPWRGEYVVHFGPDIRLEPFQGFWLYSQVDGNILFFAPAFRGAWQVRNAPVDKSVDLPALGWLLRVVAQSAAGRDGTTWVGVSADAQGGLDNHDLPKVPMPPQSLQVSAILRTGRSETPLSIDLRAPRKRLVWTLEILNPVGGEVQLQFDGIAKVPRSVQLTLYDSETNQHWSLRPASAVTVLTQPQQPKRLQLVALQTEQVPLRVQGLKAIPMRGRGAHIQFTVTMPAQVQVQIRTLTGRVIWETVEQAESGRTLTVFWNGRSRAGDALPAGTYMVTVRAITEEGHISQAQTVIRWR